MTEAEMQALSDRLDRMAAPLVIRALLWLAFSPDGRTDRHLPSGGGRPARQWEHAR